MNSIETLGIEISIVVPAYNEEEVIIESLNQISNWTERLCVPFEIIVVDDGSTDRTYSLVSEYRQGKSNIRLICLNKNAGHMQALLIGLKSAHGNYIVTIDADLQDPPSAIVEMYKMIKHERTDKEREFDVIQTSRKNRKSDSLLKRNSASIYYYLVSKVTNVDVIAHAADYRLITKEVALAICNLPEPDKVLRLLIPSLGFNVKILEVKRNSRLAGESKYGLAKMTSLALNSIFAFSNRPLRLISLFGVVLSIICLLGAFFTFFVWLNFNTIPGWTSIIFLFLTLNSILFITVGILGEYVGRIYEVIQKRSKTNYFEV